MKRKHRSPWAMAVIILALSVAIAALVGPEKARVGQTSEISRQESEVISEVKSTLETSVSETGTVQTPGNGNTEPEELIGVWVPYLTLATGEKTEAAFCKKIDTIISEAAAMGINTLFVHVRPFGDALYPSDYFPWSHIVSGEQGKDPGFDPLAYMVQAAHGAGLQFHAWVNPLRISLNNTPASFSPDNPYIAWQADEQKKDMFLRCESGIYYDPGYAEVRDYITAGIVEIVENYDVDGIHFDDYFYPTNEPDADAASYAAYLASVGEENVALPKDEWRMANINALVSQVYAAIKTMDPDVTFGISPVGVVKSNAALGADVTAWCAVPGYVDYICPQLYYSLADCPVTFGEALEAWNALPRCEAVELYIGLAVYKAGTDADNGAWEGKDDILAQEIQVGRTSGAAGFVFYAWDQMQSQQASAEVAHALDILA